MHTCLHNRTDIAKLLIVIQLGVIINIDYVLHTAGMNTIDSDHENHAQYQRSVPPQWTTDQQIDDILLTGSERLEVVQTITPTVEPRSRADHTWPNKTVYYTFGQTLSKEIASETRIW